MKRELPEKCCKTCQHYVPHYTRSARGSTTASTAATAPSPASRTGERPPPPAPTTGPGGELTAGRPQGRPAVFQEAVSRHSSS